MVQTPRSTSNTNSKPAPVVSNPQTQTDHPIQNHAPKQDLLGLGWSLAQNNYISCVQFLRIWQGKLLFTRIVYYLDDAVSASATPSNKNSFEGDLLGISFAASVNISDIPNQSQVQAQAQAPVSSSLAPDVDLFGESSASEQQRKMNKESILKLYASNAAASPMGPMNMMQQPGMYGMAGIIGIF